jgi:hypothetical protein
MLSYINLLYLLLDTVQFTVKVPNVMIQIKLKEDDADPEGEGLLVRKQALSVISFSSQAFASSRFNILFSSLFTPKPQFLIL